LRWPLLFTPGELNSGSDELTQLPTLTCPAKVAHWRRRSFCFTFAIAEPSLKSPLGRVLASTTKAAFCPAVKFSSSATVLHRNSSMRVVHQGGASTGQLPLPRAICFRRSAGLNWSPYPKGGPTVVTRSQWPGRSTALVVVESFYTGGTPAQAAISWSGHPSSRRIFT
jgi:hypothetical protein